MRKFLFVCFFLVIAANLGLANKLPNVTAPALPSSLPTSDPISLLSNISPKCLASLVNIVTDPEFAKCIPVGALLPLLTDPTLLPSVLKDPVKNGPKLLPIIDAVCALPKCSDKGVAAAIESIKEGCTGEDLTNPLVQLALTAATFYSPVRDIICFKDHKGEYCTVETITTILSLPPSPIKILGGVIDKVVFAEPKFICTPCNKAMVNTLIDFFTANPEALDILEKAFNIGEEELKLGELFLAVKCGTPFVDGKVGDPSVDPKDFEYQEAGHGSEGSSDSARIERFSYALVGTLVASTLML